MSAAAPSTLNYNEQLSEEFAKYGIVYAIHCLIDGKYYIGQTIKPIGIRWSQHKHESRSISRHKSYLHKAIAIHGEDSFTVEVLSVAYNQRQLNKLEHLWICLTRSFHRDIGYNLTSGGDSRTPNESVRLAMSIAAKRRCTPEWRANKKLLAKAQWSGKPKTDSHKRNISAANKGTKPSILCRQRVAEANRKRHKNV